MTFKVDYKIREYVDNYEIFLEKNKIFHSRSINVNNYLYPIYFYKKGDIYISSTSVFELIKFKKVILEISILQQTIFIDLHIIQLIKKLGDLDQKLLALIN